MRDEQAVRDAARAELRSKLTDGLARARLAKSQLAQQTALSRTTIHQALQVGGPVPSPETVAALSRVLRLPEREMQDLRRAAIGETGPVPQVAAPGKPIGDWNPFDLEVHPSGLISSDDVTARTTDRLLSAYVPRAHDRVLENAVEDALQGRSRLVVLVGSSSTGKTRACWEAVQPLADHGWRLWHPFDPTRAEAALAELERVQPHTVVWLNESQHYLGDRLVGERVAAAVHSLLTHSRGPVLVLGTLWPEYADQYTYRPDASALDPHSQTREVLDGCTVTVPDAFDQDALGKAADLAKAGDGLLAGALTRAKRDGRVTQDLAGAPELLRRYERGTPAARAVLEAAMDARRLGVGLHLPQIFLTDAAFDYLTDHDYDELGDDWAEAAFAELARPVHGKQAPLRRTGPRPQRRPPSSENRDAARTLVSGPVFRLADYLEQHGRATRGTLCPPASFWYAAHTQFGQPEDLQNLARAADHRHRRQWAHHLWLRAAEAGSGSAMEWVMQAREQAGNHEGAKEIAWRAVRAGYPGALVSLAWMKEEEGDQDEAESIIRQAADSHPDVLVALAVRHEEAGDYERAEVLYRRVAMSGHAAALSNLARLREVDGDHREAEEFALKAAKAGLTDTLIDLAQIREQEGDLKRAEVLYRQASGAGSTRALADLPNLLERAGDSTGAEQMARKAVRAGITRALADLARQREEAGDFAGAEAMAQEAVHSGSHDTLLQLASMREHQGNLKRAEALYQTAADAGATLALVDLVRLRRQAGDLKGAEAICRKAVAAGHTSALVERAQIRDEAGDRQGAETAARAAAEAGHTDFLTTLARGREKEGDTEQAEALYRLAVDAGDSAAPAHLSRFLEGAGDIHGAEEMACKAAAMGNTERLFALARGREKEGDTEQAEALYRLAVDAGDSAAPAHLSRFLEGAGDIHGAEEMACKAAAMGNTKRLFTLARKREKQGDTEQAKALYRLAADARSSEAGEVLVQMLEKAGDCHGAELAAATYRSAFTTLLRLRETAGDSSGTDRLYRQAVDAGRIWDVPSAHERWPYGLDPDGSPTPPWE
ncbi:hypothetical protein OG266_13860 [Streptomyces sp. NBC_00554]|uniref:tetratricopeptide repeat protein n=1 Tax=Streptomyces sp. NBC_00554 TaxID=2903661 RepID=UPI00352C46E1|nr:hypothetical protein OG266_13860 [Streptomyces sp. NBC_00554]